MRQHFTNLVFNTAFRKAWFFLACLVFLAPVQTPAASLVYVANSGTGTISTINSQSNTVVETCAAPTPPESLAVGADGTYLYLSDITAVSVIQAVTCTVTATVGFLTDEIGSLAVSPDGQYLWVSLSQSNRIALIDLTAYTVIATVGVGARPWGIAFTPDGSSAFVTNTSSNSVSVIDTATLAVLTTIPTGVQTTGIAASPGGTLVYATNLTDGTVSVIDVASNTVTATVPVGTQPWGVAFKPNGKYAYVANGPSNNVSVIKTATASVIATIPILADNSYDRLIAITADGTEAYVTNYSSGTVSVIDTTTNLQTRTIATGDGAIGVAIGPPACAAGNYVCGCTQDAFENVPALYNGADEGTSKSCAGSDAFGLQYQCPEYVNRFYAEAKGVNTSTWRANGGQYYADAAAFGLVAYPNCTTYPNCASNILPQPGDIVSYCNFDQTTGLCTAGPGHASIIEGVTTNGTKSTVMFIEQNYSKQIRLTSSVTQNPDGTFTMADRDEGKLRAWGWLRLPPGSQGRK